MMFDDLLKHRDDSLEDLLKRFEEIKANPKADVSEGEYVGLAHNLANKGRADVVCEMLKLSILYRKDNTVSALTMFLRDHGKEKEIKEMIETSLKQLEADRKNLETKRKQNLSGWKSALLNKAYSCNKEEKYDDELKTLEEAVGLILEEPDPQDSVKNTNIFRNLGACHYRKNNIQEAINVSEQSISLGFYDSEIFHNLGVFYLSLKDENNAVKTLERAIEYNQTDVKIFTPLLNLYWQEDTPENLKKIMGLIERAFELGAINKDTIAMYKYSYSQLKEFPRAIKTFEKTLAADNCKGGYISLNEDNTIVEESADWTTEIYSSLAECHSLMGNLSAMYAALNEAISKDLVNAQIYANLMFYYNSCGKNEAAIKAGKLALTPKEFSLQGKKVTKLDINENVFRNLAVCYKEIGDLKSAINTLEEAVKTKYAQEILFANLSDCYHESGDSNKAIEICKKAIESGINSPRIYFTIAKNLMLSGNINEAIKILESQVFSENDNLLLGNFLGELYAHNGETEKAVNLLEKLTKNKQIDSYPSIFFCLFEITNDNLYLSRFKELVNKKEKKDFVDFLYLASISQQQDNPNGTEAIYYFKEMIQQMMDQGVFKSLISDYKQTSHKIKLFKVQSMLSDIFFIKEGDKSFDAEKELNKQLKGLIGEEVKLPDPISSFNHRGKFYYVMSKEEGQTLTDLISCNNVPEEIYNQILKTMAKIHVLMPIDQEKYSFDTKLTEKILKAEFNESMIESTKPIIEVLKNSKNWCYNKDSATDNWMVVDGGKILVCDTEDRNIVPYAADLAQFLNCIPKGTLAERMENAKRYISYVNQLCEEKNLENRKINDPEQFILEYCNAVIFRSIAHYQYLFSKEKPAHSKKVIESSIEMIDYMQSQGMIKPDDVDNYRNIRKELESRVNQQ